jgi:hypothetical protein
MFEEKTRCLSKEEWKIIYGDKNYPEKYQNFWDSIPDEQKNKILPTQKQLNEMKKIYETEPIIQDELGYMFNLDKPRISEKKQNVSESTFDDLNEEFQNVNIETSEKMMKKISTLKKKARTLKDLIDFGNNALKSNERKELIEMIEIIEKL